MGALEKNRALSLRQITTVNELLVNDAAKKQLASIAAKHMNPERMMRTVANAFRTTPLLKQVEPLSMLGALMSLSQIGLEPNTPLGHAWLVPFKNGRKSRTQGRDVYEVNTIIGYKGYLDLAFRTGKIIGVDSGIHYSDDVVWEYERGLDLKLRHVEGPGQGEKLHAYAIIRWQNEHGGEGKAVACLPWERVMAVRDASQAWQTAVRYNRTKDAPWHAHEDAMAMKTAVREIFNRGRAPMAIEMAYADEMENRPQDYQGFAMNPSEGLQAETEGEGDGEMIEGSAEPQGDEGETEQEQRAEKKAPEKKAPPKKRVRQTAEEEKKPEPEPDTKSDDKPAAPPKEEPKVDDAMRQQFAKVAETIINDMADADHDDVLDLYADKIEEMEARYPDLHKLVMDEADAYRAGSDDEPGGEQGSLKV